MRMSDWSSGVCSSDLSASLVRIEAPYFVAGVETENGVVIRAAPILSYMRGWEADRVLSYAVRKDWAANQLKENTLGLNAKNAAGAARNYEPLPAGTYPARLVQVVDLGLQPQRPYQGQEKSPAQEIMQTGRAHVCTPVTNAHPV